MRILVQDIESNKYLTREGEWTTAPTEARDFPITTLAYDVAKHVTSGRFGVILHFCESGELVNLVQGSGWAVRRQAV
jgi:hypothetical protein